MRFSNKGTKEWYKYQFYYPEMDQADELGYVHLADEESMDYIEKLRKEFIKIRRIRKASL